MNQQRDISLIFLKMKWKTVDQDSWLHQTNRQQKLSVRRRTLILNYSQTPPSRHPFIDYE